MGTQPTKVAGTLRRAVRLSAFNGILGGRHMECAYYFDFCRLCQWGFEHHKVNHGNKEYARDDDGTAFGANTVSPKRKPIRRSGVPNRCELRNGNFCVTDLAFRSDLLAFYRILPKSWRVSLVNA